MGGLRRVLAELSGERYDVALSLHGRAPRTLEAADAITSSLQRRGLKVFHYRTAEQDVASFGQVILPRLEHVYGQIARQVVVVGSPGYGREGLTADEWEIIRRRAGGAPEERFLTVITTSPKLTLLPDLQGRVFTELATTCGDHARLQQQVRPVIEAVLTRLGRWPRIKNLLYTVALFGAAGAVLALWASRAYVETPPKVFCGVALVSVGAWLLAFRLLPRNFPSLIYGPRSLPARIYRNLYLDRYAERLAFAAALAACALAAATLPSMDVQVQRAMAAWLGAPGPKREAAQRFFKDRMDRRESLSVWFRILADSEGHRPIDRGKALELICRLLPSGTAPLATRDVSGPLRAFGERGELGLTPATWPQATSEIDISGLNLESLDFSRLSFTGRRTRFENATLRQSRFPAAFFQATQCDRADFSGCEFTLASFAGIRGAAHFALARAPGATFFGCDLAGSRFYGADLTGTKFLSCKLAGADFTNAHLTGATFEDCDLTGSTFTRDEVRWGGRWGNLAGTTFIRCRMGAVGMRGGDFRGRALAFVRSQAPDPSDLGGVKEVVTRDMQSPGVVRSDHVANFAVPPATILGCDFVGTCDLAGVEVDGLQIDRASYESLTPAGRHELVAGGLEPATVLRPESNDWALERRFPSLVRRRWDKILPAIEELFNATRSGEANSSPASAGTRSPDLETSTGNR